MHPILGSDNKDKILRFLAKRPYKTAKEISVETGVDYKYTFKILQEFIEKDVALKKKNEYYLNNHFINRFKRLNDKMTKYYAKELMLHDKFNLYNMISSTYKDDEVSQKIQKIIDDWTTNKLNDWYTNFYDPDDKEYSALKKTIESSPNHMNILEIGCGTGRVSFRLAEDFHDVVSVDKESSHIRFCKKKNKFHNLMFKESDIIDLSTSRKYDVIIFSWMGLHFRRNYKEIIEHVKKMMHKNSTIIIMDALLHTDNADIVRLIRKRNIDEVKKKREDLKVYLMGEFENFSQKSIRNKYVFPSMEDVIKHFKIQLTLEHSHVWTNENEEKVVKYLEKKGDSLEFGSGLVLTVARL
jgi:2-polyprenyl-3-methyl-5-hydroxy-6-metoxy-1,4-benzoquinol methylase